MNSVTPSEERDAMNADAARREELKAKVAADDDPPPLLHPEMAGLWVMSPNELPDCSTPPLVAHAQPSCLAST